MTIVARSGRTMLIGLPGWVQALGLYLLTRLVTTAITLHAATRQAASLWTPEHPSYSQFVTMWDAERYLRIAEQGYPRPFPVDPVTGDPTQSDWAFYPAYPGLLRAVAAVTGQPVQALASPVSVLVGACAVVGLYVLFRDTVGHRRALLAVAVVTVFPSSPVLQYGYSESLALAGLSWALVCLQRRRPLTAVLPALLLTLSRPVGGALVLTVLVIAVVRWVRRHVDPVPRGELWRLALLAATTGLGTAAFPLVVAAVSGHLDGYTRLQVAWRVQDHMDYLTPWLWMSQYLFGQVWGVVVVVALLAGVVALLASRALQGQGLTVWSWTFSYLTYLAVVVDPFTSVPRFLLLLAPAAPLLLGRRARPGAVAIVLVVLVAAQVWWIEVLWHFTPPSDYPP